MRFWRLSAHILIVALSFSLFACAIAPTKRFIRTGPTYEESIPEVRGIGIINDVCIARDVAGSEDCVSIEDSRLAESLMLESAKTHLEEKGYRVDYQSSPFVGAFKDPEKTMKVQEEEPTEPSQEYPPFFVSDTLMNDEDYQDALKEVIREFKRAVSPKNPPSDALLSDEQMREHLATIADRTNVKNLLVLVGDGRTVPAGKSVAQGIGTAIVTGLLTGGLFVVAVWDVSCLDTHVGLMDLKTGEILWSNSLKLKQVNLTKKDFYLKQWAPTLLYHIPTKETETESEGVEVCKEK